MKCSECEHCCLEGYDVACEPQDFVMEIESQAEYKTQSEKKEVAKDEK